MKVLGINGGNGVMLYPFKNRLICNIEPRAVFHTKENHQWELNFKGIPLIKKAQLPDFKRVDVILSHPDCGHSSMLAFSRAKKMGKPKENISVGLFFESLVKYKPKLFLMENLSKFIENYGEEGLKAALTLYNLVFHHISVSELGNSQKGRHRLLIIGVRKDLPKFISKVFLNLYRVNELKASGMLIRGLNQPDPNLCHIRESDKDIITLYAGYKDVIENIRKEWVTTRALKKRWDTPDKKFSTAPGVYKNLEFELPATVRPSNRQYNHRGEMMSPRELARIQGVPDQFKLYCDTKVPKYCINKGRVTVTKTPPMEVSVWFYMQTMKIKRYLCPSHARA